MSSSETIVPEEVRGAGIVVKLFAAIGVVAVAGVAGALILPMLSSAASECRERGEAAAICTAGALGLVDLGAVVEKNRAFEAAKAEAAAKAATAGEFEKRAGDLEGRVKELEGTLAASKAATAEVDRLRAEVGRRDAKIAELTEKLAGAARKPEAAPPAAGRPAAPLPKPAPKP